MRDFVKAIPFELLIELAPEELAAKLLFAIRGSGDVHLQAVLQRIWDHSIPEHERYPSGKQAQVQQAIAEAWAWLTSQGLVLPRPGDTGGWCMLSRRAMSMADEREFANYSAARRLLKEWLHPKIASGVWAAFMRGEFDVAAFLATRAVEVAIRTACDYGSGELGVDMARKAFHEKTGPLTDMAAEKSEQLALAHLFAGALGYFKNPQSHREVGIEDPARAAEIVMLSNHLLFVVDARAKARGTQEGGSDGR